MSPMDGLDKVIRTNHASTIRIPLVNTRGRRFVPSPPPRAPHPDEQKKQAESERFMGGIEKNRDDERPEQSQSAPPVSLKYKENLIDGCGAHGKAEPKQDDAAFEEHRT